MTYDPGQLGQKVVVAVRNELYMNFPYMDQALCGLELDGETQATRSMATDGQNLYFAERWVTDRYVRSRTWMNRAYLHVIFHCLLRHIWKARGKDAVLWDLACDTAVAALFEDLNYTCLDRTLSVLARNFLAECQGEMKVITAEGVYQKLLRESRSKRDMDMLRNAFLVDDHRLWVGNGRQQNEQRQEQDENWQNIAQRSMSMMRTMFRQKPQGGQAIADQIRVELRDDVDYRGFLRRFAAPREVMQVDAASFDYIFYTYGLELYGNMPLVEPLETKEEKRIEDLVIAVDTSMSTSGEMVRAFLACTYAILRSTETYTRKVNIHIIQCDNKVRADDAIHDMDELHEYMEHFTLKGGDSTDFRPVFDYVRELREQGEFTALRGLIYFTDGLGFYPKKRPEYETAFVFLGEPPESIPVPPWAIRLVLEIPDLYESLKQAYEEEPEMIDWDELPRT